MAAVPTNTLTGPVGAVGTVGAARSASAPPRVSAVDAAGRAMSAHLRSVLADSKVDYSPAWKDAKVAIRLLNHVSPLLLGAIQRHDAPEDAGSHKAALDFMLGSTEVLARIMSEKMSLSPASAEYDRIELSSMLTHMVGRLWEKSSADTAQRDIDDLLRTVATLFSDADFLKRHQGTAERMMRKVSYARVDSPETMETRLRQSMHQAVLRLYEGVTDDRVSNGKGACFTYGLKNAEVLAQLRDGFEAMMGAFLERMTFSDSLSNDQRTGVMQSWIRHASEIYRAGYVTRTQRLMGWFIDGKLQSVDVFQARFIEAKATLPEVIQKTGEATLIALGDLAEAAGFDGARRQAGAGEQDGEAHDCSAPVDSDVSSQCAN